MFHSLPHDATPIDLADVLPTGPMARPLMETDRTAIESHLLRLDGPARRMRFGTPLKDEAIRAYARRAAPIEGIGLFDGARLRGLAELHRDSVRPDAAEAAFSLEADYRRMGHGTRLFGALLDLARQSGIGELTLQCLRENLAMQRIARRFAAELSFDGGETIATLRSVRPRPAVAPRAPMAPRAPRDWLGLGSLGLSSPLPA